MIIDDKTAYVYEDGFYFCIVCHENSSDCVCEDEERADMRLAEENAGIEDSWYEEEE